MKTVLVFGISGFSGRAFQEFIHQHGFQDAYRFVGVSRSAQPNYPYWKLIQANLTDSSVVEELVHEYRPAYILNLAGKIASNVLDENLDNNMRISQRILEACRHRDWNIEKIVVIGTAAEYGKPVQLPIHEDHKLQPLTPYGISKVVQTEIAQYYARAHQLPVCIIRPFNLVGKGMPTFLAFGTFIRQIQDAKPGGSIKVGNLTVRRDFVDVRDAMDAYWRVMLSGKVGEVYNICSGKSWDLEDLLLRLIKASGKSLTLQFDITRSRANDVADIYGSYSKIHADTGWAPQFDITREVLTWLDMKE